MPEPKPHLPNDVSIESLLAIFYAEQTQLATFQKSPADQVPEPYARLLNHTSHMTVTVEEYYQDTVDVRVLRSQFKQRDYCREIILSTHRDAKVVQYGIQALGTGAHRAADLARGRTVRSVPNRLWTDPRGIAGGAKRYLNVWSHSLDPLQSRARDRIARNCCARCLIHLNQLTSI